MKDLGAPKQILSWNMSAGVLNLSYEQYIENVLSRSGVNNAKPRSTPLGKKKRKSNEQSFKITKELENMANVPYAFAVGSLMYVMVDTRPDITHAVGAFSRYMSNQGKDYWEVIKHNMCNI